MYSYCTQSIKRLKRVRTMGGLFSRNSGGIKNFATAGEPTESSSSTAVPRTTVSATTPAGQQTDITADLNQTKILHLTSCPECEVLRLCNDKIETAIKAADPLNLTMKLYANGLIEAETRDSAVLPIHTSHQKAHIITSAVERRVEADPSLFDQFTELLQNEGDYILRSLGEKLQKDRDTLPPCHTPHQPSLTPSQSPLSLYADKLRTLYAQSDLPRYSNPACYKWTPSPSKKYIDLTTIDRERMTTQQVDECKKVSLYGQINTITIKNYHHFWTSTIKLEKILQGDKLECVLVEGAPGIGKSTLAWQLCNRWGKRELYQQYSIVMLLPLRDQRVQRATCVEDLFISTDPQLQDNVCRQVTQTNWDGKDALIILEGLDELPSHLLSQPSIFTALLSGTELHQATILVTSRPSAMELLQKHWNQRISRHFEIKGFTDRNIARYAQSVLSDDKQLSDFAEYVSHFQSLLYVPLHCVIAITVYLKCHRSRTPPPKTLTGLYTCLTQTILCQYLNDHSHYTSGDYILEAVFDLHIPCPVHNYFKELCRIAFEHLNDQQLVFSDLPKEMHELGFTDAVPELLLYEQSANYSYNFLHLSIQEFLAAYHISLMSSNEQEQLFKTEWYQSLFKNMHRFLAGISKFEGLNRVVARQAIGIDESISERSGCLNHYSLEMLYECQDMSILDTEYIYTIKLRYPSPHICLALGYCITNSSCRWKLKLHRCTYETQAEMILQGLKERKVPHTSYNSIIIQCINCSTDFTHKLLTQHTQESLLLHIKSLDIIYPGNSDLLRNTMMTYSELSPNLLPLLPPCLPELVPRMKILDTLTLENVHATSLIEVIPVLSRVTTLKNLTLSKLTSEAIILLSQWLSTCHLETLTVNDIFSPLPAKSNIDVLSRALSTVSSLKVLNMNTPKFAFQNMQAFGTMLQQNQSLTEIRIRQSFTNCESACYLAEALYHNTTLRILDMSKNPVGERGALAMAEILKHNTTLEELDFFNARINCDGAVAIAEALNYNTSLRKLNLSLNSVEERGALAMAEMFKHNHTLEELYIANTRITGDTSAVAVAEALHDNLTALRKLDIRGNPVRDKAVVAIAEMLKHNTILEELDISNLRVRCDGAVAIAKALHHNTALRKLDLSWNSNKERGALAMAEMLKHNITLEKLDLSQVKLGDKGVTALLQSLGGNQHLKKLIISDKYKEVAESLSVYHDHKERVELTWSIFSGF